MRRTIFHRSLIACLGLAVSALAQSTVPTTGSCSVSYNPDGSANLVCTTSIVLSSAPVSVVIAPGSATLPAGGVQQFAATVTGTGNQAVTWSTTGGTISSTGLFTAPSSPGTFTVSASSIAYPSQSASVNVTVTGSATAVVSVTPASATVPAGGTQQFTATVTGTSNQAVTWSTTGGTISTSGLFTAPSSPGTAIVTARSVADSTQAASATVTINASGTVGGAPTFTGNFCTGATGCTLNNVTAGNMLVIGGHGVWSTSSPITISDSQNETAVFDAMNVGASLYTWHIAPVQTSGTHVITANGFNGDSISVAEITGVASGNPVEAVAQNFFNHSSTDDVSILTQTANDMVFAYGRAAPSGTQQSPGFTAIRTTPTMEYAAAPTAGPQNVSIQPLSTASVNVGIQALAIRPAGSPVPPVTSPGFTGNFCFLNGSSCTMNNVAAGNMLVISSMWYGRTTDVCQMVDSAGETVSVDRQNDSVSTDWGPLNMGTWHIANVTHSGTHTISVAGGGGCGQSATMVVSEFTNQNTSNPIDTVSYNIGLSGSTATTSAVTSQGNDLIYAFCAFPDWATTGTGDGFASISMFPTAEYRLAGSAPGTETATCPVQTTGAIHGWVIQELAIRH